MASICLSSHALAAETPPSWSHVGNLETLSCPDAYPSSPVEVRLVGAVDGLLDRSKLAREVDRQGEPKHLHANHLRPFRNLGREERRGSRELHRCERPRMVHLHHLSTLAVNALPSHE